ncbi:MAG: phage holin family protein [Propionibacteriaceae bacterium]|jgi:membrane protein implicated in regulation of membrane protease activity|nr:phage holin family protein [Propionibacteriaceae bacterium]
MPGKPTVADLTAQITADVRSLIAGELALAKAELEPAFKRAAAGGGLSAAAIICGASAALVAWFCAAAGFAWLFASTTVWSPWACVFSGFATALILALVAAALTAALAYGRFKGLRGIQRTPEAAKQAIAAVHDGIASGKALVRNGGSKGAPLPVPLQNGQEGRPERPGKEAEAS